MLRLLNEKCEFLGPFSRARMSEIVIDDCRERGIRISNCPYHENTDTPFTSIILNESTGTRTILHTNNNLPILTFDDFRKICLNHYKWAHFEARNATETKKMIELVVLWNKIENKPNITISVELENLKEANLCLIEQADFVFLSKDFACMMGWTNKELAVHNLRKYVKNELENPPFDGQFSAETHCNFLFSAKLICAWGAEGAVAIDHATDTFCAAPAYPPAAVVDSLGAGDTFVAATIHDISNGRTLHEAIDFGCRVAGAKCGFHGYDPIKEAFAKK